MFAYRDFIDSALSGNKSRQFKYTEELPKIPEKKQTPIDPPLGKPKLQLHKISKSTVPRKPSLTKFLQTPEPSGSKSENFASRLNRTYRSNNQSVMRCIEGAKQYPPILRKQKHPRDKATPNSVSPRYANPLVWEQTPRLQLTSKMRRSRAKREPEIFVSGFRADLDRLSDKALVQDMEGDSIPSLLEKFLSNVSKNYSPYFQEIDLDDKGYFRREDLAKLTTVRAAKLIYKVFHAVEDSDFFDREIFLAVCSIFEYTNPGKSAEFDVFNPALLRVLASQITDLREIYSVYTVGNRLRKEDLDIYCKMSNLTPRVANSLEVISASSISFAYFLRHLPYFLWFNRQLLRKYN